MKPQTKEEQLRREELSKERLKEAIYNLEIRVETAKDVELLTLIKEAYFLFPSLSSYKSELKERGNKMKVFTDYPDTQEGRQCRHENSLYNKAIDDIINLIETDGK